jgi:SAM-dependent methyltransferase
MKYDLKLFKKLNKEYEVKRIVKEPLAYDEFSRRERALRQAHSIHKQINLKNKRILEIGCGFGDVSKVISEVYNSEVVAVDILKRDSWDDKNSEVVFIEGDIINQDVSKLGKFDRIISFVAWEHIENPFSALKKVKELLNDSDSLFYLYANLYRGPLSSHLYREIFFPWPTLLFSDDVFESFYKELNGKPQKPCWINKLTYQQYLYYFKILGFKIHNTSLIQESFDESFYNRFKDKLSQYPYFDLATDFFKCILSKGSSKFFDFKKRFDSLRKNLI